MSCEVDYGILSKIGNHYIEKDLYSMALRNGLEDRPYIDWVRADKCCYIRNEAIIVANANADTLVTSINKNRWCGVGSVPRIIPGVDYALVVNRP